MNYKTWILFSFILLIGSTFMVEAATSPAFDFKVPSGWRKVPGEPLTGVGGMYYGSKKLKEVMAIRTKKNALKKSGSERARSRTFLRAFSLFENKMPGRQVVVTGNQWAPKLLKDIARDNSSNTPEPMTLNLGRFFSPSGIIFWTAVFIRQQ